MEPTDLHLYDFDGTLFRSPVPPPGWGDKSLWFATPESLGPPCVPVHPPVTWWIPSTIQSAKRSIRDKDVYTILATGRKENVFRDRIDELLKSKGLDFDEVHLKPHGRTMDHKAELLLNAIEANPSIEMVEIWEDREPHMAHFRTFVRSLGVGVKIHPVKFAPMPARCAIPSPSRVASLYLAGWPSRAM